VHFAVPFGGIETQVEERVSPTNQQRATQVDPLEGKIDLTRPDINGEAPSIEEQWPLAAPGRVKGGSLFEVDRFVADKKVGQVELQGGIVGILPDGGRHNGEQAL
jgi:hypothetical protein